MHLDFVIIKQKLYTQSNVELGGVGAEGGGRVDELPQEYAALSVSKIQCITK